MIARHLDILKALESEVSNMREWVEKNRGDIEINRMLNTEEGAFDLEEIEYRMKAIFEKSY